MIWWRDGMTTGRLAWCATGVVDGPTQRSPRVVRLVDADDDPFHGSKRAAGR